MGSLEAAIIQHITSEDSQQQGASGGSGAPKVPDQVSQGGCVLMCRFCCVYFEFLGVELFFLTVMTYAWFSIVTCTCTRGQYNGNAELTINVQFRSLDCRHKGIYFL